MSSFLCNSQVKCLPLPETRSIRNPAVKVPVDEWRRTGGAKPVDTGDGAASDPAKAARVTDIGSTSATVRHSSRTGIARRGSRAPQGAPLRKRSTMNCTMRETDKEASGQRAFHVGVSRARDRAAVPIDNREDLVEALEAVARRSPLPPSFRSASRFGRPHPLRCVLAEHSLVSDAPKSGILPDFTSVSASFRQRNHNAADLDRTRSRATTAFAASAVSSRLVMSAKGTRSIVSGL